MNFIPFVQSCIVTNDNDINIKCTINWIHSVTCTVQNSTVFYEITQDNCSSSVSSSLPSDNQCPSQCIQACCVQLLQVLLCKKYSRKNFKQNSGVKFFLRKHLTIQLNNFGKDFPNLIRSECKANKSIDQCYRTQSS